MVEYSVDYYAQRTIDIMTINEAFDYIEYVKKAGRVLGLENITELLRRLGNPQDKLNVVHVAGTNGKGSTCTFLSNILMDAGYSVGRYISPTVFSYFEAFQINGNYISEEDYLYNFEIVKNAIEEMVADGFNRPTLFETETALTFMYFLNKGVDVVVLEVGMGGITDATNVLKKPLCTVICSISLDHMEFLGDSLSDILNAKMGIMKKNVPCICDVLSDDLKERWHNKCNELQAKEIMINEDDLNVVINTPEKISFVYEDRDYEIHVPGIHQVHNSILAIKAAEEINGQVKLVCKGDTSKQIQIDNTECRFKITYENISAGLSKTFWPGRLDKISENPVIYVDGAHNEGGWKALAESVKNYFADKKIIYICGVLKDKEYTKMLELLGPYSEDFIAVTPPNNPRALDADLLKELARAHFENVYSMSIDEALENAEAWALGSDKRDVDKMILIFGSLSFIGPIIEKYRNNIAE